MTAPRASRGLPRRQRLVGAWLLLSDNPRYEKELIKPQKGFWVTKRKR